MSNEDIMRLLELDDPNDEEKFRMAMEMPLSPTLPEIEMPNMEASQIDAFIITKEGIYCGLAKGIHNTLLPCCFNALNVETDSNKLISKALQIIIVSHCLSRKVLIVQSGNLHMKMLVFILWRIQEIVYSMRCQWLA
ncbi:hypothetical protein AQUCO_06200031v1 [Aquilegia coerulea]|uniref:Uncharacterized protein n=1 Tax=Aquilegia coerulea TaxID=218851 RepID=A0A2G5CD15_AQUCA|nr:hypothetical protein AQUCO_06200031v1 [Aquilegia coerulea]